MRIETLGTSRDNKRAQIISSFLLVIWKIIEREEKWMFKWVVWFPLKTTYSGLNQNCDIIEDCCSHYIGGDNFLNYFKPCWNNENFLFDDGKRLGSFHFWTVYVWNFLVGLSLWSMICIGTS